MRIPYLLSFLLLVSTATASEYDLKMLQGLQERRLFDLGSVYTKSREVRLQTNTEPEGKEDQVDLALGYASLLGYWAMTLEGAERQAKIDEAIAKINAAISLEPPVERKLELKYRRAELLFLNGQQARIDTQLSGGGEKANSQAVELLRKAISELTSLEEELTQKMAELVRKKAAIRSVSSPEAKENKELQAKVRVLQSLTYLTKGDARLWQGQCYQETGQRASSLTFARENYKKVNLPPDNPRRNDAMVGEVRACRLQGDYITAESLARAQVESEEPPPPKVRLQLQAEILEGLLDQYGVPETAAEVNSQTRAALLRKMPEQMMRMQIGSAVTAELFLARHRYLLLLWKNALLLAGNDPARQAQAKKLFGDAMDWRNKEIQQRFGGYWLRLAEADLEKFVPNSGGGVAAGSIEAILETAKSAYQNKKYDAASEKFATAAKLLGETKPDQAFEYFLTAARIQAEQKNYAKWEQYLIAASTSHPSYIDAKKNYNDAIALARFQMAQKIDAMKNGKATHAEATAAADHYFELLEKRIKLWPKDPALFDWQMELAMLYRKTGKIQQALDLLQTLISPANVQKKDNPKATKLTEAFLETVQLLLALRQTQLAAGKNGTALVQNDTKLKLALDADKWAATLEKLLYTSPEATTFPKEWTETMRNVAQNAVRIRVNYAEQTDEQVEKIRSFAQRVLLSDPKNNTPQSIELLTTLVYSQAKQGKTDEAQKTLGALSQRSTSALVGLLDRLLILASDADAETKESLAILQLEAVKRLLGANKRLPKEKQFSAKEIQRFKDIERYASALSLQARAAKKAKSRSAKDLSEALQLWQGIAAKTKKGSKEYFDAKYQLAVILVRLNRKEEAKKQVDRLQILYPEMGGPRIKARFEGLKLE